MGDGTRVGIKRSNSRGFLIAFACLALLAGRMFGITSRTNPHEQRPSPIRPMCHVRYQPLAAGHGRKRNICQRGDHDFHVTGLGRADRRHGRQGARSGWLAEVQRSVHRHFQRSNRWIMSLKKGQQALNVFISIAPAQGNATSVQYAAVALKTDLPFTKDASNIEYSPDRPLLTLVTAEPVDKTWIFIARSLASAAGRCGLKSSMPSSRRADRPVTLAERGGSADYVNDKEPGVALILTIQKAEAGKFKIELKEYAVEILASLHRCLYQRREIRCQAGRRQRFAAPRRRQGRQRAILIGPVELYRSRSSREHDCRDQGKAVGRRRLAALRDPLG